jgi:hypothetical protein
MPKSISFSRNIQRFSEFEAQMPHFVVFTDFPTGGHLLHTFPWDTANSRCSFTQFSKAGHLGKSDWHSFFLIALLKFNSHASRVSQKQTIQWFLVHS